MTDADNKIGLTVLVTVKLLPDEYDELFQSPDRLDHERIFTRERDRGH
jgi:hypothetical protein